MKNKKGALVFVIIFLFGMDLFYSYHQHLNQNIDGDFSESILPMDYMQPLWDSPLGTDALIHGSTYHNPNRFFSHFFYYHWFDKIPQFLQLFFSPVDSLYHSAALFKLLLQLSLILLLARLCSWNHPWRNSSFFLCILLLFPLVQTNGYQAHMGIIDRAITYVFFYAFPLFLLGLYLFPVLLSFLRKDVFKASNWTLLLAWLSSLCICLSGPLNPAVLLVFILLTGIYFLKKRLWPWQIPLRLLLYLMPALLLSLYSLYLGQFNSTSLKEGMSLLDLYAKVPMGIWKQFTQKLAFPMLFVVLTLNYVLLRRQEAKKLQKGFSIKRLYAVILLFTLVYIILLPLGGYRPYRPYILRYDTIMPITIALFFLYAYGSNRLLQFIEGKRRRLYIGFLSLVLLAFTFADQLEKDRNICQKQSLHQLANTESRKVVLSRDCLVLSWKEIEEEKDAEAICKTLYKLGIIDGDLSFRQE